ncbi:MAG: hypothetical protein IIB95_07630 [Candidatus Marinimicrobia bacterium]|nr:hypothetical protein [Candidatus Neomarinimicrobiota bacterium]MCH7763597.1 hypothetical protein [Candidatus Neomarinimicrobiota bacterium]
MNHRLLIEFSGLPMKAFDIPKLRGAVAKQFPKFDLINNHIENDRLRYAYPSIQFKVINNSPLIVGIGDGVDVLKTVFMDISNLDIDGKNISINEKSVRLDTVEFGQINKPVDYRFVLPWMALNQVNHKTYLSLSWKEKRPFLENILRRNLKSLSKGFDYFIPDFENLQVQTNLKTVLRNFKNQKMLCFKGAFTTNFIIPDYLGIGKQTARGFGTVVRV